MGPGGILSLRVVVPTGMYVHALSIMYVCRFGFVRKCKLEKQGSKQVDRRVLACAMAMQAAASDADVWIGPVWEVFPNQVRVTNTNMERGKEILTNRESR